MVSGINTLLANTTLIAAVIISFIATTKPTDQQLRKWLAIGALLGSIHFWLIHMPVSGILTSLFGIQQLALIRLEDKKENIRLIAFILFESLYIGLSAYQWKGLSSIIPLCTLLIMTYGFFYLKGNALRKKMYVVWGLILINTWILLDIKHATITTIALLINIMIIKQLKKKIRTKIKNKSLVADTKSNV